MADKSTWPEDLKGYCLGNDGVLVVSFDGGETYLECETVKNVNVNTTVSTIDTTTRRSGFFKEELAGKAELSIDGEMLFDATDACYQQLQDAYLGGKVITVGAFLSNGNGPLMRASISDFTRSEELEGVVSVSAKYSNSRFIGWFTDSTSITNKSGETVEHPCDFDEDGAIIGVKAAGGGT